LIPALLLPLAAISIGIVRAELHSAHSTRWVFDTRGYDPRDLLRGQYIAYRISFDEMTPVVSCSDDDPNCCLCLRAQSSGVPPKTQRTTCDAIEPSCDGRLRTQYLSELQRYYISERDAVRLNTRFQNAVGQQKASVLLAIDAGGKPAVDALLVGGERLEKRN
jgi:uncharacterized membrane-anchored protein